jgi:L-ascorbate metabolism protein UlaG (beta-lactamase superfamily)
MLGPVTEKRRSQVRLLPKRGMPRRELRACGLSHRRILMLVVAAGLAACADPRPRVDDTVRARAVAPLPVEPFTVAASWTGVAGVRLEARSDPADPTSPVTTLLIDPYMTRHSYAELVRPVDSDTATVQALLPRADALFVGHAHHDHLGDVPALAARTGAKVHGSASACTWARTLGPAACELLTEGNAVRLGPFEVTAFESGHGETAVGVPFPGEVPDPPGTPWVWRWKMGGAYAFVVRVHGRTLYHQGSAGLRPDLVARLAGLKPDLAFVGLALRGRTPGYEEALLDAARPRIVVPIHWDAFFGTRLDDHLPPMGDADLASFERRVVAANATYRPLKPFERMLLP